MGDSIGEGVQSADASVATQQMNYPSLLAWRMGEDFPRPFISTTLFAGTGDVTDRTRFDPTVKTLNLAVSGADVNSLINNRAVATTVSQISSENELVLFPWTGSQLEIAEGLRPQFVSCWIGNNDALASVTAYSQLDASQLTSVANFSSDFMTIATRLKATGAKVVFGTIPDVTRIGFLVDNQDLIRFFGTDYGLPAGSRTSIITMILIRSGLADPSVLTVPNYVLDPGELALITSRISQFNAIIKADAAQLGFAVADVGAAFDQYAANPPVYSVPLTSKFLGGLLSLDGVHPSNIGHALVTNLFLQAFNNTYGTAFPLLDSDTLNWIAYNDPFVDLNQNGRVRGRFGAGFLETLMLFVGISGDDEAGAFYGQSMWYSSPTAIQHVVGDRISIRGKTLRNAPLADRFEALGTIFGLTKNPSGHHVSIK
jgi:hypothetical protein